MISVLLSSPMLLYSMIDLDSFLDVFEPVHENSIVGFFFFLVVFVGVEEVDCIIWCGEGRG